MIGYALSGIAVLFLVFDTSLKLFAVKQAVQSTIELGYPGSAIFPIGVVELVCLALYLVPVTSVSGAILLVGYLGGAVATQLRAGNPLATHVLFPIYVAAMLCGGLYLREPRLRALLPFRR
jgi:DoxX-like family